VKLTEGLVTGMVNGAALEALLPASLTLVFQPLENFLQLLYLLPRPQDTVFLCLILVGEFQLRCERGNNLVAGGKVDLVLYVEFCCIAS